MLDFWEVEPLISADKTPMPRRQCISGYQRFLPSPPNNDYNLPETCREIRGDFWPWELLLTVESGPIYYQISGLNVCSVSDGTTDSDLNRKVFLPTFSRAEFLEQITKIRGCQHGSPAANRAVITGPYVCDFAHE